MIRDTATSALRTPLPGNFYRDESLYLQMKKKVFLPSWQFAFGPEALLPANQARPFTLLPGYLNEPMLQTSDEEGVEHLFANVCSHRGNLLVRKAGPCKHLVCPYHGRRFSLNGQCKSQPGLNAVPDFPGNEDHLHQPETASWGGLTFARILPGIPFQDWIKPIQERVGFLPLDTLIHIPERSHIYKVKANWALYVENYLEGLHIPFVHPTLREALDLSAYPVETNGFTVMQSGIAKDHEPAFDLPASHPDHGKRIYAWYFWLFPNLMLNFYPWGLSLNLVQPQTPKNTRIRFVTYRFAGQTGGPDTHALHDTELEDESIVETVQAGVRSSLYKPGRMVPGWEDGVIFFHQCLLSSLYPQHKGSKEDQIP